MEPAARGLSSRGRAMTDCRRAHTGGRAAGCIDPGSEHLEQPRRTHAPADAHADHHMLDPATLAFEQGMPNQTRSRHAKRMADGDRATVDVEAVVGDAERSEERRVGKECRL